MRKIVHKILLFFFIMAGKILGIGIIHRLLLFSGMNEDLLRKFGAKIGEAVRVNWPLVIFCDKNNYSNLSIGNRCHIGKNCFFDISDRISIGNNVTVSMQTTILTHMDVCDSYLSKTYPRHVCAVNIDDDVYVGAGTVILCGVHIGKGALIGAHSLVNKNIAPGAVVAGIPNRPIKTGVQY